jgi:integrase
MTSARPSDLRPLSPEERERLLSALRSEGDRIMLRLLLETGRPLDDLRGARVSDLDRDRSVLRLKREDLEEGEEEVYEISLSPELSAAVGDYLERNPGKTRIFEGRCGRPVGPKWVRCTLLPAAIRSGLQDPRPERDRPG